MTEYICVKCHYKTNRTSNWNRHKKSRKHLDNQNISSSCLKKYDPICNQTVTKMQPVKSNELTVGTKVTDKK